MKIGKSLNINRDAEFDYGYDALTLNDKLDFQYGLLLDEKADNDLKLWRQIHSTAGIKALLYNKLLKLVGDVNLTVLDHLEFYERQ